MNEIWCFLFKGFLFQDWAYATERCNNAIILIVQSLGCQHSVPNINQREILHWNNFKCFRSIFKIFWLETHNNSLKFKTEIFFISQCLSLLIAVNVIFIFPNSIGPVSNPGNWDPLPFYQVVLWWGVFYMIQEENLRW